MRISIAAYGVGALAISTVACVGPPPPMGTPPQGPPITQGQCLLSKADPGTMAFCDTFDAPKGNPGTRSGDLDPTLWGVSRIGNINPGQGWFNTFYPATMNGCGNPTVLPPETVKVCNGRLYDVLNDHGGVIEQAIYPKQPWDIAGRTGTVAFDVSDDSEGTHAAWPEFWWTDQPIPAPNDDFPVHEMLARNAVGVSFAASNSPTCQGRVTVDAISVVRNHVLEYLPYDAPSCVVMGNANGSLNHFEIRMNQNRIEVWGSDAGWTAVRLIAVADNANVTMTRGVIWLVDAHYNAVKGGTGSQITHTFAWDNVAFDGPKPYRDLTFDVPESKVPADGGINLGWPLSSTSSPTLQVTGVGWSQTPKTALVTFSFWGEQTVVPSVSVNGLPAHSVSWPFDGDTFTWRTIGIEVPVSEVRGGTNSLTFSTSDYGSIANVNLALIAAAPVP